MAKQNIVVIDTETAPIVPMGPHVDARKMRVYDVGYIVKPLRGTDIILERSFVVSDTFFDHALMNSAYYADKVPTYRKGYNDVDWHIVTFADVWHTFINDCREYDVREVWAFNARFDMVALNETIKEASRGFISSFLPDGMVWRDIWPLAQLITGTAAYNEWAYAQGLFSEKGIAKTGVEAITRYINNDNDFSEAHTALDDARHEAAIMDHLRFRHYRKPDNLGFGWRAARDYAIKTGHYVA